MTRRAAAWVEEPWCQPCWVHAHPGVEPRRYRPVGRFVEVCSVCGILTRSHIYGVQQ